MYKEELGKLIDDFNLSVDKQADIDVEKSNNKLFIKAITIYGSVFIVNIILASIISYIYNIDLIESLFQNINLLIVVVVTEFFFLRFIITYYISADPNKIKKAFINLLLDN
jgi:hypothetical protein